MKIVVKCYKHFFGYFNALETHSAVTSSISGITAFALAMILGITSLPSVTNILTWKEFGFVQSKLGWLSLCCGTAYDLFNGYNMDVAWDYFLGVKCNFFLHGGLVSIHRIYFF